MAGSGGAGLPAAARVCVLAFGLVAGGIAALIGLATDQLGLGSILVLAVLSALVLGSWLWPIVMYSDGSSQTQHLDEGFFVVMALLLPPCGVLLAFLVATTISQVARRRAPVKTLFNIAQITISVAAGLVVARAVAPLDGRLGMAQLGAASLGALVFFAVNSLSLAAVIASTGGRFTATLFDGAWLRSQMLGGAVSLGILSGLALHVVPEAAPIVVVPFVAFRQALNGHFLARHDRTRLLGLFQATLAVTETMGTAAVEVALCDSAAKLLRCPHVSIESERPDSGVTEMAASMSVNGEVRWLRASGRSHSEPLDTADQTLLEALAALGASALENAALYEERKHQQERLVTITSSLGEGVCAFDKNARVTFANPAALELLGCPAAELAESGEEVAELEALVDAARKTISSGEAVQDERATFLRRHAGTFPVEVTSSPIVSDGESVGAVLAFRDISERVAAEAMLEYHAFHDSLTGLPNRRIFLDRLQHALRRGARGGEVHAILLADIDRFKLTNDSLGQQAGDELLVAIAGRLRELLREGDTLCRFGGDEFTILLEDIDEAATAERLATRMLDAVCAPITLDDGRTILASVSIGIALGTVGDSADDVLHDADVALFRAKQRGTGLWQTFDAVMGRRSAEWLDLEVDLRRAIEEDGLVIYYQPVVATQSERIVGAEALVRWPHPSRGLLPPADFIGLAEETGLILPLGRQVLEKACRQAREWNGEHAPISIAVNLSVRQFQHQDLVKEVRSILLDTGLPPSQLCLEITETVAMHDIERTIRILAELKSLGIKLAIDDFGTGHSSLNYLKRFPVDIVKLDRTFVQELDISLVDTAIVSAVVNLASAAGMRTVAEGVETADQLERLKGMGCPMVQGFFFARPMPPEQFAPLLGGNEREKPHEPRRLLRALEA